MPSALLAANTTPSVAQRPTSPLPTGVVWLTVAVSGLMRQTCPRESETQTACLPAVNATGYPMGTSAVAVLRVRLDAQGPLGHRHHPECFLPERHAYRYLADVDDRGGLVRRRVDAEHMVRTAATQTESSSASTA